MRETLKKYSPKPENINLGWFNKHLTNPAIWKWMLQQRSRCDARFRDGDAAAHRVCFTGTGLAVGQDRAVVPRTDGVDDAPRRRLVDFGLRRVAVEAAVDVVAPLLVVRRVADRRLRHVQAVVFHIDAAAQESRWRRRVGVLRDVVGERGPLAHEGADLLLDDFLLVHGCFF